MAKGLFELLERHHDLEDGIVTRLKALGLTLCANLPPAFSLEDLRYVPAGREIAQGYYFVCRYKISNKFFGYVFFRDDLSDDSVQYAIEWVVKEARRAAISRIII